MGNGHIFACFGFLSISEMSVLYKQGRALSWSYGLSEDEVWPE